MFFTNVAEYIGEYLDNSKPVPIKQKIMELDGLQGQTGNK